jgi:hypothetical protein
MSIPPPPPALLRLARKVVSLLGNGSGNKYIFWQLPQCIISSNPYGGNTGTYGLLNCIAIQNGAISAVVWFYLPPGGQGALLGFEGAPVQGGSSTSYPSSPYGWTPWLYVGTNGILYAGDWNGSSWQVSTPTPISPGWHMAVIEEWAASTSGPYYLALYLDGQFIGQSSTSNLPQLFGYYNNCPNNHIGVAYTSGWPSTNNTWFFFNGAIAYVALYNRVLSPGEVVSIYQGNRDTNGLVAEYVGDNYDPSSGVWFDDVGSNNAYLFVPASPPEVVDLVVPTEFTSGINYEVLARRIAEVVAGKPINIANLPIDNYGYINIDLSNVAGKPINVDQWNAPYVDLGAIANNPLKNAFSVLSNASITSNGSSGNYSAGPYKNFLVTIYVGSVSGTSPSLTVYFNAYDSNSGQSIPLASVTLTSAGGTYIYVHDFPGNQFNISWTVGGTSPSFGSVYITVYESW